MTASYSVSNARAQLAHLIDMVERGEEVAITRRGRPAARLVPAGPVRREPERKRRGAHRNGEAAGS